MSNAILFDIERNSYVDGPGIRTTVFFKGCNLHCVWCHNPESQSFSTQMMFYTDKCIGCGKCRQVCAHQLQSCSLCGKCTLYCPKDARKICGKEYTAQKVLSEVKKDKAFYDASGGGVTCSGGECMLQPELLLTLLSLRPCARVERPVAAVTGLASAFTLNYGEIVAVQTVYSSH